jgi:hypothetical protein
MSLPWAPLRLLIAFSLAAVALSTAPGAHAASCGGASHQLTLASGQASPGSGTVTTTFTFSVLYTDSGGCAPTAITVKIPGLGSFALSATGTNYAAGVTYRRSQTLPAGRWTYSFSASNGSGQGRQTAVLTAVSPGAVIVAGPTAAPTPTLPPSTATPRPRQTATPAATAQATPVVAPPATTTASASGSPTPTPDVSVGPSSPASSEVASPGAGLGGDGGEPGGQSGSSQDPLTRLGWVGSLLALLGAAALATAIFLHLAERATRHDHGSGPSIPSDEPTQGNGRLPAQGKPLERRRPQAEGAGLPRWLRPSVQSARFAPPEPTDRRTGLSEEPDLD